MKNRMVHLLIGTFICAAMILAFLSFGGGLPENVPIQIGIDGNVSNSVPKPLFIFGLPGLFTAVNLIKCIPLLKKREESISKYYVVPASAIAITVLLLCFALSIDV